MKMLIAVLVTLTAPIWIIPVMIVGAFLQATQSMYKLLWGDK